MGSRKFPTSSYQERKGRKERRKEVSHLRMKPLYGERSGGELGRRGIYQFAPVRGFRAAKFEGTTNDSGEKKRKKKIIVSHFSGLFRMAGRQLKISLRYRTQPLIYRCSLDRRLYFAKYRHTSRFLYAPVKPIFSREYGTSCPFSFIPRSKSLGSPAFFSFGTMLFRTSGDTSEGW